MTIDALMIENLIRSGLPEASVSVEDLRGDGKYYAVVVVSDIFNGKSLLEQHRMVFETLKPTMADELESGVQLTTRVM